MKVHKNTPGAENKLRWSVRFPPDKGHMLGHHEEHGSTRTQGFPQTSPELKHRSNAERWGRQGWGPWGSGEGQTQARETDMTVGKGS